MKMISYIPWENILVMTPRQECQEKVEFLIVEDAVSSCVFFLVKLFCH